MDNLDKNRLRNMDSIEHLRENWQSSLVFYFMANDDGTRFDKAETYTRLGTVPQRIIINESYK